MPCCCRPQVTSRAAALHSSAKPRPRPLVARAAHATMAAAASTSTYKLSYFAIKGAGNLALNMGRVPLLLVDGAPAVGQSKAIERFLARKFGLFGKTDLESAHVDMLGEHLSDIKESYSKAGGSGEDAAAKKAEWVKAELGGWLDKLEAVVALTGTKAGFSVGESLSLADIQLYSWASMFDGFNDGANKPAFDAELAKRPKLSAVVDAVAAHDGVKAWVAKRPQTKW